MTGRHGRAVRASFLIAATMLASGCGGDDASDRAAAAHRYAAAVAQTTDATRRQLAETSRGSDYRDAAAAATTTRAYATAIRATADDLGRAEPPASVAARHRELIALYRQTATRLDALAAQFATAPSDRRLTALAQELSGEVQGLSTREAQLRAAIDQELARIAPTNPTTPAG